MYCVKISHSVAVLSIWLGSVLFIVRIKLDVLKSYFRSHSYKAWCDWVIVMTLSDVPQDIPGGPRIFHITPHILVPHTVPI